MFQTCRCCIQQQEKQQSNKNIEDSQMRNQKGLMLCGQQHCTEVALCPVPPHEANASSKSNDLAYGGCWCFFVSFLWWFETGSREEDIHALENLSRF